MSTFLFETTQNVLLLLFDILLREKLLNQLVIDDMRRMLFV